MNVAPGRALAVAVVGGLAVAGVLMLGYGMALLWFGW